MWNVDSKFWTHAKTFLRYLQLQEMQLFRKFGFYPASTFAKKFATNTKKNFATHEFDYPHATAFFTLLAL